MSNYNESTLTALEPSSEIQTSIENGQDMAGNLQWKIQGTNKF